MLNALKTSALDDIAKAEDLAALESLRVALLGKKGSISEQMKKLGGMGAEERKSFGAEVNVIKEEVEAALAARKDSLTAQALEARLAGEYIDATLPARPERRGGIHPLTRVTEEIITLFAQQGFSVAEGPDIEDDFHNFTALNIPPDHPARQMHDTFYLQAPEGQPAPVLRTHTSPVQIRHMMASPPPYRIIAPGSTYRCDSDATHSPMFHQVEGLVIDRNIHMGHLKGCLEQFLKAFFELAGVPLRLRPSFFPFTEPSAELDIGCKRGGGQLLICEGSDWLEILGCGMVHPQVLRHCGLDPEEWQGFAFGMGIERLAMLKYGMPDVRDFFSGDLRWLKHHRFQALDIPSVLTAGLR